MSHHYVPEDPHKAKKLRALWSSFVVLLVLAAGLALTGIAYLSHQAFEQSNSNGMLINKVEETNSRLVDCTTPSGKCYQQSSGSAVLGVNETTLQVIVAALSCQGEGLTDQKELARCTAKRLKD